MWYKGAPDSKPLGCIVLVPTPTPDAELPALIAHCDREIARHIAAAEERAVTEEETGADTTPGTFAADILDLYRTLGPTGKRYCRLLVNATARADAAGQILDFDAWTASLPPELLPENWKATDRKAEGTN